MSRMSGVGALALASLLIACSQAASRTSHEETPDAKRALASAEAAAADAESAAQAALGPLRDLCKGQSDAAGRTMHARQLGVAMSTVMEVASGPGEPYVSYVKNAYARPLETTEDARERAVAEFRDEVYSRCLSASGL